MPYPAARRKTACYGRRYGSKCTGIVNVISFFLIYRGLWWTPEERSIIRLTALFCHFMWYFLFSL